MRTTVVVVVLLSGVLHAIWNAITKNHRDQYASFALLNMGMGIFSWIALPFVGVAPSQSWPYVGASVCSHIGYELFLMGAYKRGDFSKSYPIARGIAPLLVSLGGFFFASEHLHPLALVGVVVIVIGITSLAGTWGAGLAARRATYWALGSGVAIAFYTVIDGLGVRSAHNSFSFGATLFAIQSTIWVGTVILRSGFSWWPTPREASTVICGGILSMVGYATVLWAQLHAPFGLVSALRETGVFWAAVIGVFFFKDGKMARIILPAIAVCSGIVLLSLA